MAKLLATSFYLCLVIVEFTITKNKPPLLPVFHTTTQFGKIAFLSLIFLQECAQKKYLTKVGSNINLFGIIILSYMSLE